MADIVVLLEKGLEPGLTLQGEYVDANSASSRVFKLLWAGHKVMLVYNNAWSLWKTIVHEAWMRGENYFLIDALDPYEAKLAGTEFQKLLASRIAYFSRIPAEQAEYEKIDPSGKLVSRRALLASLFIGASMTVVEKPIKSSLCNTRGLDKLCQLCLEECEGNSCATALCPTEFLLLPSYSREALLDYIRLLQPVGPGYMVFASRWSIDIVLQELKRLDGSYTYRTYLVPVNCPYVVGLEELLAIHALGLKPLIVYSEEAHRDPYCLESRDHYIGKIVEDYKTITREEVLLLTPEESIEILVKKPAGKVEARSRGYIKSLRVLALEEATSLLQEQAVSTRSILVGVAEIDQYKCTLCTACVKACPTRALKYQYGNERESISFMPANCIACNYCVDTCPENAIKVKRLIPKELYEWRILVGDEIEHCIVCGKPLSSKRQLASVIIKLKEKGFGDEILIPILLCSECKVKYWLGLIKIDKQHAKKKVDELLESRRGLAK